MLKIEFDSSNTKLALAIGKALVDYASGTPTLTVTLDTSAAIEQISDAHKEVTEFNAAVLQDVGKPADIAAGPSNLAQTTADTGLQRNASGAAEGKRTHDEKGVMFIPAICATAAKPFYASGPYKGQWKKGTKVDQAEYDRVYGAALAALGTTNPADVYPNGELGKTQTQVGQSVANSSAAEVFSNPIDETINEIPGTPNDVFTLYTWMLQNGGTGVANAICAAAGIQNGSLIFSRPDLAPRIFKELTTAKGQLVAGQGA